MRGRNSGKNTLELDFEQTVLVPAMASGEVSAWAFEPFALRLAPRTTYTPDFLVQMSRLRRHPNPLVFAGDPGSLLCVDVKGHREDDARVKIKTAAELFPMFAFVEARTSPTSTGWRYEYLATKRESAPKETKA